MSQGRLRKYSEWKAVKRASGGLPRRATLERLKDLVTPPQAITEWDLQMGSWSMRPADYKLINAVKRTSVFDSVGSGSDFALSTSPQMMWLRRTLLPLATFLFIAADVVLAILFIRYVL